MVEQRGRAQAKQHVAVTRAEQIILQHCVPARRNTMFGIMVYYASTACMWRACMSTSGAAHTEP
jgi:hypothetical protein